MAMDSGKVMTKGALCAQTRKVPSKKSGACQYVPPTHHALSLSMSKPAPSSSDACILCNKIILQSRQAVVSWEQTMCTTHPSLRAHYTCFVNETTQPVCRCPDSKAKERRHFPINHGDSLAYPPLWVNEAGESV